MKQILIQQPSNDFTLVKLVNARYLWGMQLVFGTGISGDGEYVTAIAFDVERDNDIADGDFAMQKGTILHLLVSGAIINSNLVYVANNGIIVLPEGIPIRHKLGILLKSATGGTVNAVRVFYS